MTRVKSKSISITTNAPTRVFILNGVRLVPHFFQKDTYVAPGSSVTYSSEELIKMGATPAWYPLWERANLPPEKAQIELEKMREVIPTERATSVSSLFQ